jgi:putative ABC transport system permease protein
MLTGLCSGLTPALQAVRGNIQQHLKHGWRHTNGGSRRVSNVLVIMELATAIVLLVISGLLLRSLWRLFDVTPGFNPSRVITMQVQTIGPGYSYKDEPIHVLQEQMLDAVKKVPGVKTAALTSHLPMSNDFLEKYPIFPESSHVRRQEENDQVALRYAVTSDYFKAMGIELRSGRLLDEHDRGDTARVVLINESFAKRLFRDINPIGQRLHIGSVDRPSYTIVGVVGDVRHISLVSNETNAVYTTPRQWPQSERVMSLVVGAKIDDPVTLLPAIRDSIHSVDKDQPLARTITMDVLLANSTAERRFVFFIFEVFAIVALLLAGAGIYGILAGNVAERTLEIGVRMALGASRGNILALVGYHGMILTGIGAIIGVVGALVASRAVTSMLFNVSPLDPITYISVVAVLIGVSLIACAVPAWRAVRVDPTITLRKE